MQFDLDNDCYVNFVYLPSVPDNKWISSTGGSESNGSYYNQKQEFQLINNIYNNMDFNYGQTGQKFDAFILTNSIS